MKPESEISPTSPPPIPPEHGDPDSLADFAADTAPLPRRAPTALEASPEIDAEVPPTVANRRELLLGLLGISSIAVMVAFDSTIVSTTLPRIADALDGMMLYAWVGSGYLLTTAVTVPIFGRMGDLFGRKRLMIWSVLLISLCSIACGLAQDMLQLVIARTVQGIGGGMMIASAFAAPADLLPDPKQRVRWMAVLSAAFAVASGVGPVLGGAITQSFGWRMAFAVVPIAAIPTLWVLHRHFPDLRPAKVASGRQIDWIGGLLLMLAVGGPLLALEFAFSKNAQPVIALILLGLSVAAAAVLLPFERRTAVPMLPLRVLASREAQLLSFAGLLVGAVMFNLIYFGPLVLQNVLLVSPRDAGLLMTPLVMCIPIASIANGYIFPRLTQPQRLMTLGAVLLALGCLGVGLLDASVPASWAMAAFALAGLGLGFLLPNLTMFIQMICERRDVGVASALIQTSRAIGSAAGIAALGVVVARTNVLEGVRIGMGVAILGCVLIALLVMNVRMRNTQETRTHR